MSPDVVVFVALGLLLVLLCIETPVAFALAAAGATGIMLLRDVDLATSTMGDVPLTATAHYSLVIIPMYVVLGMFALHGNLAGRVYAAGSVLLRRLPGGLGVATVAACAGFSAVSGSSVATAASMGKLSVTEMMKAGYKPHFATGIVAIAGTLGILIPPSVALVIYGVLARESIAQLLVAGIIPGVLSAAAYAMLIAVRARKMMVAPGADLRRQLVALSSPGGTRPAPAFSGGSTAELLEAGEDEPAPVTRFQQVRAVCWLMLIFGVVLTGVFSGVFTVIESAAVGAIAALIMLFVENLKLGSREILRRMKNALLEAAGITAMSFALVVGAAMFSVFLVMARVPMRFTEWVAGIDVPPMVVVALLLAALIPLGMFLDPLAIIVIVVPLVHPAVTELGFDGIWFAVLFVMLLEIGLVTPPVGINTFVVSMTSGVKVESVFRGVFPFLAVSVVVVVIVFVFPETALWLPSMVAE
ncbi:TRAP transporter, DctM subunit [Amycolatopsis marina]|uniref:TRAP transporter, DctM subunit n=1 Tax=Amycolatopsis marina TaxID=490629 RepID=A0A1I0YL53_9PSEU|nr:TRAP transporter large permease [Amycolatopsis marina]SFB13038.1 TRAP transporter, DctM subunit [Amycolatopsis marina]